MKIQERIIVTTSLLIVCGSMFFSWFGGSRGVQELSGTIVLLHPVTISCILAILIGVWAGGPKYSFLLTNLGFLGLIMMEVFYFLDWHIGTISGRFSITESFQMAYPEFYVGLTLTTAAYFCNLMIQKPRSASFLFRLDRV